MPWAMHDGERQLPHLDLVPLLKPSVRRHARCVLHAEVAGALDDMLQEKQIVPMGSLDRHLETRLQVCGAGGVIDMAMGQPDLVDGDIGLSDRSLDVRQVATRINDHSTFGGFAPQQGAVLLKGRDWNNESLRLGHGWRTRVGTGLVGRRMAAA